MTGGIGKDYTNSFNSMQEFIKKFDASGDGQMDKDEITAAQQYFKEGDISSITINGVDYNLLTDENKNKFGTIKGTKGNDFILSADANKIKGKGGSDIIVSSDANKIVGGKGNDQVYYSGDGAVIKGGKGNDTLDVDGDSNKVRGGKGNDDLDVDGDNNDVKGQSGKDQIDVTGDHNTIRGGLGIDTMNVEGDYNDINGNGGDDKMTLKGNHNTIKGGMGMDSMDIEGDYNDLDGGATVDKIKVKGNYNNIDGSGGGDRIWVDGNNNNINAGDWTRRNIIGRILTAIPKVAANAVYAIAEVVLWPFSTVSINDKTLWSNPTVDGWLQKIENGIDEIWGDYSNEVFVNGENNTVKTNWDEDYDSTVMENYDTLYQTDGSTTNVKGDFLNERNEWQKSEFEKWVNKKEE